MVALPRGTVLSFRGISGAVGPIRTTKIRAPAPSKFFTSSCRICGRPSRVEQLAAPKAELEVGATGRFAKVIAPRRGRSVMQRVGSTFGGTHTLKWLTPPRAVLLIVKRHDPKALFAARKLITYMRESRPELEVVVETEVHEQLPAADLIPLHETDIPKLSSRIDFVVALGGDGTLLRVSSLFDAGAVPPVLGLSGGSLGFLMPFHLDSFPSALEDVLESRAEMLLRMRLQCVVTQDGKIVARDTDAVHAMNEVTIHRGPSSHLISSNVFVNGQHLTEAVADGLLVSTPTGSTAYSLSAGGAIVHPSVQSMSLSAIAARSLSFRNVLLPSDVEITLSPSPRSRTAGQLSLDGREERPLTREQSVNITMSPFPVPCISPPLSRLPAKQQATERDSFLSDLSRMLGFNAPFNEGR